MTFKLPKNVISVLFVNLSFSCCMVSMLGTCAISCVSQDKYDRMLSENEAAKKELDDLKFGAPTLLADSKSLIAAKNYKEAADKLATLIKDHPSSVQASEAKELLNVVAEEQLWVTASSLNEPSYVENYIASYPSGKYVAAANKRLKEVLVLAEQSAFEYASSQNSSNIWKNFLERYPKRNDAASIKRKIIALEVDEIMGSSQTGKLPSSELTSYGEYSSSSSMSISNDTECELIVRYSGEDVKMISIPAGGTRSVNLASGSYRIAASACGSNYAGAEQLQGSYSSRYYIVTSRY